MRRMMMGTVAIAVLALTPNLVMAQGGPADRDRGGPDAGGRKMDQGDRDRGGGGGGQRMRGDNDRPRDQDRMRGDNDRPRGDQDRMRGDNDRPRGDRDRMRGDNDRPRGDRERVRVDTDRQDRVRGDNDRRERVRVDGDRRPAGRDRPTVRITTAQKAQVRTRFRGLGGERIRGGDFAVDVGRPVPTQYRFSRLPPEIVEVVPEYRDYDYVRVGEQVLIVDPDTREIVEVLD